MPSLSSSSINITPATTSLSKQEIGKYINLSFEELLPSPRLEALKKQFRRKAVNSKFIRLENANMKVLPKIHLLETLKVKNYQMS